MQFSSVSFIDGRVAMPHLDTFVKGREGPPWDSRWFNDEGHLPPSLVTWVKSPALRTVEGEKWVSQVAFWSPYTRYGMYVPPPHTHTQQIYNIWSKEKSTLAPWHPGWWFLSGIIFAVTTSSSGMGYTHSSLGSSFREMEFLISSQKKWMNVCMNEWISWKASM